MLSDNIVIENRTRYSVWDLLGDVGGFNDGLILVCQLLTSAYTAASFRTKYLASSYFDSDNDADSRSSPGHRITMAKLKEQDSKNIIDPSAFEKALTSAESLKQSFIRNLFFCKCQTKRQKMLQSRVMDDMTEQLDIRSFLKMYLDVRLLLKRTMTKE